MESKWYIHAKRADFKRISEKFGIDPVIARVIRNRDIITDEEIDYFLNGGLEDLYDGMLIPDMAKARDAVCEAVLKGEHIRIVGDYDIDGVCSTYILLRGLKDLGANADYRIPDRINDGYGINIRLVEEAAADRVDLLVTCDNGIAAINEMERAAELGLKVVITDHHSVRKDENGSDILPKALAVADVKRSQSAYPTDETCGAVTAWKLIREVYKNFGLGKDEWLKFIDLAAIATVGDIMELTGENRIIVREGLKYINRGAHRMAYGNGRTYARDACTPDILKEETCLKGLLALIDELGISGKNIDTYHIGFVIGPCINAGGRLETAESAMKLFTEEKWENAVMLAGHLKALNQERKLMTEEGAKEGIELAEKGESGKKVLVIYLGNLHESLAGIVAGRIKEHFGKPCFVITDSVDGLKGSGRSIEAYDMFSALCEADGLLTKYGGHTMAAGLSLKRENLEPLRKLLNENARLEDEDFIKKIWIDDPAPLSYINEKFVEELESLAPYGHGFEKPVFAARGVLVAGARVLGKNRNALKMDLQDAQGRHYEGIMFGDAESLYRETAGNMLDIIYSPSINEYMGRRSVQFTVEHFRKASAGRAG